VRRLKMYIVAISNITVHKALLGRIKRAVHVAHMEQKRGVYRGLVGTSESDL